MAAKYLNTGRAPNVGMTGGANTSASRQRVKNDATPITQRNPSATGSCYRCGMWHYLLIALGVAVGVSVAIAWWRDIAKGVIVVLLVGSIVAALAGLLGVVGFGFWALVLREAHAPELNMALWGAGISFVISMIGAGIFNAMQAIGRGH
jgi:hypothetical protein